MTGPEHYRRAQQIVNELEESAPHTPAEWHAARSAQAQVHATLALSAATIDAAAHPGQSQVDYLSAWWEAGI